MLISFHLRKITLLSGPLREKQKVVCWISMPREVESDVPGVPARLVDAFGERESAGNSAVREHHLSHAERDLDRFARPND